MRHWQVLAVVVGLLILAVVFVAGRQVGTRTPLPEIAPLNSASQPNQPSAEPGARQGLSTPSDLDQISGLTFANCPPEPFQRRPLLGASAVEVAQYAFHYTCHYYRILGSPTTVRLSRLVTPAQLPSLGLSGIYFSCDEPGLSLVVLQGDFDMSGFMPMGAGGPYPRQYRVPFIGYIFNHRVGLPNLTALSATGGKFKIALNDPRLPDEPVSLLPTGQAGSIGVGAPTVPVAPTTVGCGTPAPTLEVTVSPAPTWDRSRIPHVTTPDPYPVPTRR